MCMCVCGGGGVGDGMGIGDWRSKNETFEKGKFGGGKSNG